MTKDHDERIVAAWEALANRLGEWNEIAKTAIGKQWPEPRERRDAVISKLPTEEDKIKAQTGNTSGPIEDWLGEFDPEEEIGPREKEFLERRQSKSITRSKASPKASGSGTTST